MLDRKLAPPFQKTLSFTLPQPVEVHLRSGATIFILPEIQQNVAKIEVIFSAGKWFEPIVGLSHFTAMMLEKGTRHKNASQIAQALEYFGASLEIQPGYDFVSVAVYSLRSQWKNVFPLFLELLTEPSFPDDEWAITRSIFLQNLKINNEKTSYRASAGIRKNVFGEKSPYGSSIEEAHVNALTTQDFRDYFKVAFRMHSIYGVGQFDDAEQQAMKDGFNPLVRAGSFGQPVQSKSPSPFISREEKEGSLQSSIRIGKASLLRTDPDYVPFLLLNHVLGGYFGSRLMKNIREEKGLTYGIYSSLHPFACAGFFSIGADVNKTNVDEAVREIRAEVRRLSESLVSSDELMLSKNHFIGGLQADMANLFSVIDKIKNVHLFGLSNDYYPSLLEKIDALGAEDILRMARTYVGEDSLFEVVR